MDTLKGTLDRIKQSLDENNELLKWNLCPTKRGRILLKIEYGDQKDPSTDPQNYVSYRKMTNKENERSYHRTKNYRDNILPAKRKRNELTPESFRHCDSLSVSNPAHVTLDTSECIETSAIDHDHSVISVESECFEECLITHETSASEIESVKPEEEPHQSPVMPAIPKHSSSITDQTPPDPTAILIQVLNKLDKTPMEHADDEKPHVCELESESTHMGPCGPMCYWCVLSRKHYMSWIDYRAEQDPELIPFVEEKKSQARVKYKLDNYADFHLDKT